MDGYNKNEKDREQLLEAESVMFKSVKKELEEDGKIWSGTKEENNLADSKIASYVKASFRMYEKGKRIEGHFFDF